MMNMNEMSGALDDTDLRVEVVHTLEDRLDELDDYLYAAAMPGARDQALLEIKRLVHSMKGLSQAFELTSFSQGCHAFEDALDGAASPVEALVIAKRRTATLADILFNSVEA